jgi:hypothetical protein
MTTTWISRGIEMQTEEEQRVSLFRLHCRRGRKSTTLLRDNVDVKQAPVIRFQ